LVNVCFLTPEFYPVTGGTGSYVYNLSRLLIRCGNEVFVVTKDGGCYPNLAEAIHTVFIKSAGLPVIDPLLFYRASRRKLSELKSYCKIDILHANLPLIPNFAVPRDLGEALISTVHSTWEGEANAVKHEAFNRLNLNEKIVRLFTWFLKQFEYDLLKRSDRIIAVSEYTKGEILRNYDLPAWKIKVIFNGVDLEKFKPANDKVAIKRRLGFKEDELLILYVGRLYSRKGLPTLISSIPYVVRKIRNVRFLISGKGLRDEEQRLKGYVKKFKVESNVCFLGYYPDEMLPRLYQAADIFVFPSIYENMPFAVLEALASGLPVITTKVGGIPEIIDDGENGFLIEPFNARKLAERLLYLVENPTVAYEMGAAGRKTVEERFNWNKIIKQITAVYREVLA